MHVRGFESEQIYQQLKSINESRFKPFLATIAKIKAKQKSFGNLLRPPSPEKSPTPIEENTEKAGEEEHENEDQSESSKKLSKKKKKSVTYETQSII